MPNFVTGIEKLDLDVKMKDIYILFKMKCDFVTFK